MPMPDLDPARFVPAVLSDSSHKVPMPDRGGRFFSQDPASPETVDIFDPFYAALLADGSIRRACPVAVAQAEAAKATDKPAEGVPDGASLAAEVPPPEPAIPGEPAAPAAPAA